MAIQTSAGTALAVSATLPSTYDQTGFDALTFTSIGEITDLGEYGKVYELITHNPIATRRTQKFKGTYNNGSVTLQMAEDISDAGQVILDAAVDSDNDYAFRVTAQDADKDYFQAKVMSKTVNIGGANQMRGSSVTVELTNDIVDG